MSTSPRQSRNNSRNTSAVSKTSQRQPATPRSTASKSTHQNSRNSNQAKKDKSQQSNKQKRKESIQSEESDDFHKNCIPEEDRPGYDKKKDKNGHKPKRGRSPEFEIDAEEKWQRHLEGIEDPPLPCDPRKRRERDYQIGSCLPRLPANETEVREFRFRLDGVRAAKLPSTHPMTALPVYNAHNDKFAEHYFMDESVQKVMKRTMKQEKNSKNKFVEPDLPVWW